MSGRSERRRWRAVRLGKTSLNHGLGQRFHEPRTGRDRKNPVGHRVCVRLRHIGLENPADRDDPAGLTFRLQCQSTFRLSQGEGGTNVHPDPF